MKKRLLPLLIAAIFCVNAAEDKVVDVNPEDKAMNAAIEKARASLDDFLAIHTKPSSDTRDFKLKVEFQATDGTHESEHLWFMPFSQTESGFKGVLSNEPYFIPSMKIGETYEFTREQISDWGYVKGNKQIGNYTVCVLISNMDEATAAPYEAMGFQCKN